MNDPRANPTVTPSSARTPPGCTFVTPASSTASRGGASLNPAPEPCSGKHKTTGMNVQVACTLAGKLAWISDAIDGSRHDSYCLNESGVLLAFDPGSWTGDKGYVGNNMVTPLRSPPIVISLTGRRNSIRR